MEQSFIPSEKPRALNLFHFTFFSGHPELGLRSFYTIIFWRILQIMWKALNQVVYKFSMN